MELRKRGQQQRVAGFWGGSQGVAKSGSSANRMSRSRPLRFWCSGSLKKTAKKRVAKGIPRKGVQLA